MGALGAVNIHSCSLVVPESAVADEKSVLTSTLVVVDGDCACAARLREGSWSGRDSSLRGCQKSAAAPLGMTKQKMTVGARLTWR